ncbi:MAG: DUF3800 domain-containing protein [Candidatus Aenigmatarchaeota archaeon]
MGKEYLAYIDESGDEGIKKGTKWFILTAVIVEKEKDLTTSKVIDEIKEKLNIPSHKPLHWKEIRNKHVSKKRYIIDRISKEDFVYTNVIMNTYDMNNEKLQGKLLYYYSCRYLLERISWYISDNNGTVDIVISNRSSISYPELHKYLNTLSYDRYCQIKWPVLKDFKIFESIQRKMLQFADVCAGSLSEALEKDDYGYYDERFVITLKDKLYRRKGNLLSYGLKIFPNEFINKYLNEYEWINKIK